MDKKSVIKSILQKLAEQKQALEANLKTTLQAAMEAPGPMQSKSDTTRSQMNFLADEIREQIANKEKAFQALNEFAELKLGNEFDSAQTGALVEIENQTGKKSYYFVFPEAGGVEVVDGEKNILVLSPDTPLAKALLGKRKDDAIKFQISSSAKNVKEIKILNVE